MDDEEKNCQAEQNVGNDDAEIGTEEVARQPSHEEQNSDHDKHSAPSKERGKMQMRRRLCGTPPIREDEMNDDRDNRQEQKDVGGDMADGEKEEARNPGEKEDDSYDNEHDYPFGEADRPPVTRLQSLWLEAHSGMIVAFRVVLAWSPWSGHVRQYLPT